MKVAHWVFAALLAGIVPSLAAEPVTRHFVMRGEARIEVLAQGKGPLIVLLPQAWTLGIELMLAADIVVAADNCRFSQLEVKRGIMATGGATLRMAERAGLGNALLHLLTGDEFGSAEALRLNFVQKVVPAGQQLAEALKNPPPRIKPLLKE